MSGLCLTIFLGLLAGTLCCDLQWYMPGYKSEVLYQPPNCGDYKAGLGDYMYQHYYGTLDNGFKFDSSYQRCRTFNFRLGMGWVIKGMDIGMAGMCKGERRRITIPHQLGYGGRERGKIPPYSTLHFDVELDDLKPIGYKIEVIYKPDNCPRKTEIGDWIQEHYNGTLVNGTLFADSRARGRPAGFTLGRGTVIYGLEYGLLDMCVGEIRKLTIPSRIGFGSKGFGEKVPPNTDIIMNVELIRIGNGRITSMAIEGGECDDDEKVARGDTVVVRYQGYTAPGTVFTNTTNEDLGEIEFTVGQDFVLEGLQDGVIGMCPGERKLLCVPPDFTLGDFNDEVIPLNKRFVLDITMETVEKSSESASSGLRGVLKRKSSGR